MAMFQKVGASGRLLRSTPSQLTWSRGFAADHAHDSGKVPMWKDPLNPSKWKEEHFVFASLAGWGALFYGGYKFFTGGAYSKGPDQAGKGGDERRPEGAERVKVEKKH